MKKFFSVILIILLFAGCTPQGEGNLEEDRDIKIVTSFAPVYAITLALTEGTSGFDVSCMTGSSTGCLHDYSLTTADMRMLEAADLFIISGGGMEEHFLEKIKESYPQLEILDASQNTILLTDAHDETNPHIWLSSVNATHMAKNIAEKLCNLALHNAQIVSGDIIFNKNLSNFASELAKIKEKYLHEFDSPVNNKIITFHEAFSYLGEEFGLDVTAVVETHPGVAPDPRTLSDLVTKIKNEKIAAVFTEPQYPSGTVDVLKDETNIKIAELDPIVTGEMDKDSFVTRFEKNLKTLCETLT